MFKCCFDCYDVGFPAAAASPQADLIVIRQHAVFGKRSSE